MDLLPTGSQKSMPAASFIADKSSFLSFRDRPRRVGSWVTLNSTTWINKGKKKTWVTNENPFAEPQTWLYMQNKKQQLQNFLRWEQSHLQYQPQKLTHNPIIYNVRAVPEVTACSTTNRLSSAHGLEYLNCASTWLSPLRLMRHKLVSFFQIFCSKWLKEIN